MKYNINESLDIKYSEGVFKVEERKTGIEFLYQPKLELVNSFSPDQFEIRFLFNSNVGVSENSIYQLYADQIRIGWIFPIQSLESKEHDYAHNRFYLQYAYVVLYQLIQRMEFREMEYADFRILDYYPEDLHILVYDRENVKKIEDFDLLNYTVSLFAKGYSYCGSGNIFTTLEKIDRHIRIKRLPTSIRDISYINVLFEELIPLEESGYSKFHLIYQIVEILIEPVFKCEIKKIVQDMAAAPNDLFEKRAKLNEITTEKYRVIRLFNNYSRIELQKQEIFNEFCKSLLENNNQKYEERDVGNNLYAVRCLVVHNLYSLDTKSRELLNDLNRSFLDVVLDVLFTFHEI